MSVSFTSNDTNDTVARVLQDPVKRLDNKYLISTKIKTFLFLDNQVFKNVTTLTFNIIDASLDEENEILSYKNRVRGYLKELVDVLNGLAEYLEAEIEISAKSATRKPLVIKKVSAGTNPSAPTYKIQRRSLSFEDIWDEYQRAEGASQQGGVSITIYISQMRWS